jgi:uncharacterized protein GlcG (DUF336 family)
MAVKSGTGGMVALYGVAIGDALAAHAKGKIPVDELLMLRDQTKAIVDAQGDLVAALRELDAEIVRRGAGAKAASTAASERFVAQIDGFALPDKVKAELEQALQKAVMTEIAKLDTGGDMVASPLSQIKAFGFGGGRHTPGIVIAPQNFLNVR